MHHVAIPTQLGWIGLAGTDTAVCRVVLPLPCRNDVAERLGQLPADPSALPPLLHAVAEKLKRYAAGEPVLFDERVEFGRVGEFHRVVLQQCRKVPYGGTLSYGELAARAGRAGAARAVGAAMARNPVPILVPCHRVVRSDGSLGGFGGGLALKRRMLQLESRQLGKS